MSEQQGPPSARDDSNGKVAKNGSLRKSMAPAAGALVGTSLIVLLVELARSGALEQYRDVLAPLVGWGPGVLIIFVGVWLMNKWAPPWIESQRDIARSMGKLAGSVENGLTEQRDTGVALRALALKIDEMKTDIQELKR